MSGKQARFTTFGWDIPLPLPGGNIETLCKEDNEASCLYTEYSELCKSSNLKAEQKERKKQITSILQEKIEVMKTKKQKEKEEIKETSIQGTAGTQLDLFLVGTGFSKKAYFTVCFLIY